MGSKILCMRFLFILGFGLALSEMRSERASTALGERGRDDFCGYWGLTSNGTGAKYPVY